MDIENGPIWAVLRAKEPDRAPAVKAVVEDAAGLLRAVRDSFPTYTLHDEVHAANVVRLVGEPLGERYPGGVTERLVWGQVPIYKALGEVCRSHNALASDLGLAARATTLRVNAILDKIAAKRSDLAAPPEAYLRRENPDGEWWTV